MRGSGKARVMGIEEGAGMVRKDTTPNAQAALASTRNGGATRAGRHLDFETSDLCWSLVR